ncbi:uncharacterized protein F5891DRAFT_1027072 [Suillus fuscotomentosus]|uniref:Uncharacterized protein n=1 Tax=Suillus fuscotomentosus TaxID=1912939 RepID=A0AAD4E9G0_9AGAM|nr:uncharacterized protein F5891DRAFT_1027072 [Suillus fuscotomentosus]KAG1902030.1 hypothetical protein F5891DRAFT_1027072 [Suillus fuscotomentosus]
MSRPVQHAFSFLRSGMRANHSVRSSFAAFSRRTMASAGPHASHGNYGSDTPWMIGSALVFGPAVLYLLSPSARKTAHESEHSHNAHRSDASDHVEPQPSAMKDDEGTEVSGEEIKQSMKQAFDMDSPKDAQKHEEAVAKDEETSVALSETVSQESADSAPSEADSAPSKEEEPEVALEVAQPQSPANTEASEPSQEAAEEEH